MAPVSRRRLAFKDEVVGARELVCLGLHLDGRSRSIRNRGDRVWRQYYALHALCRQGRCSGKVLEVVRRERSAARERDLEGEVEVDIAGREVRLE